MNEVVHKRARRIDAGVLMQLVQYTQATGSSRL